MPGIHRRRAFGALTALMLGLLAAPAAATAQFRVGNPPEDLAQYDWTSWLVGSWEGYRETESGDRLEFRQSFELFNQDVYVLTRMQRGDGYEGFGVFTYYPVTSEAYGEWFGGEHDTNNGWAVRDGERMIWTIRRMGMKITRIRTRLGPDEYRVDNEALLPDGTVRRSAEVMRRKN